MERRWLLGGGGGGAASAIWRRAARTSTVSGTAPATLGVSWRRPTAPRRRRRWHWVRCRKQGRWPTAGDRANAGAPLACRQLPQHTRPSRGAAASCLGDAALLVALCRLAPLLGGPGGRRLHGGRVGAPHRGGGGNVGDACACGPRRRPQPPRTRRRRRRLAVPAGGTAAVEKPLGEALRACAVARTRVITLAAAALRLLPPGGASLLLSPACFMHLTAGDVGDGGGGGQAAALGHHRHRRRVRSRSRRRRW